MSTRYGASAAPRVGSPRFLVGLWIATALLCALSLGALCWPVSVSHRERALLADADGMLLIVLRPADGARVQPGDRVVVHDRALEGVVERIDAVSRSAAEIESELALAPGAISQLADPARIAFARVRGDSSARKAGDAPRALAVDVWSARSAWSFVDARSPSAASPASEAR